MMMFVNNTERGFFEFLMSRGYAASSARDYIRRMRRIRPLDELIRENLDVRIADYETGSHEDMNNRVHHAYSCALKRLREYAERIGLIAPCA